MNIPTGITNNMAVIIGIIVVLVIGGIIAAVVLIPSSAKSGDGPRQRLGSEGGARAERQDSE
jgi:hypothetical protein